MSHVPCLELKRLLINIKYLLYWASRHLWVGSWCQVGPKHLLGWEEEVDEGLTCSPCNATPLCHSHATARRSVSIYSAISSSAELAGQLKSYRLLYCKIHSLTWDCCIPIVLIIKKSKSMPYFHFSVMAGRFNFSEVFLRGFLSHQGPFKTRNNIFFQGCCFPVDHFSSLREAIPASPPAFPREGPCVKTAHSHLETAPFLTPQNSPHSNKMKQLLSFQAAASRSHRTQRPCLGADSWALPGFLLYCLQSLQKTSFWVHI